MKRLLDTPKQRPPRYSQCFWLGWTIQGSRTNTCTPQAEAAFDGAFAASEELHSAKNDVATALASLETARRVTQSSVEAMRAAAGAAQTGAAAATLQRFLDDVERVLGHARAEKGEEPRALAPAVPVVVEESNTAAVVPHAAEPPPSPPPPPPLEPQLPEPVAAPVAPPVPVPVLASPMVEVEDFEQLPAPKPPSQPAEEEAEHAATAPPAEKEAKPPAPEKQKAAAPALAIPLKNVRIAALRARADSPPGGFGSPFAGDHESSLSEGKPVEGGHSPPDGEAPPAAPEQQPSRAASPARPRVLTVPVPTASSPPSPPGEANGGSDGKGKKPASSAAGWVGGALNSIFGVVAVPERKPGGDRDGQAGSGEEGQPTADLGGDFGSAQPDDVEPATPTMFLAAAAAAVAAAPATPPGLESPPVSPRLRPAGDAASGELRAASPRGLQGPQHRSSPSLTTWAGLTPEAPPPLPTLPPSAPAAPSPTKSAAPPVPSTAAAAFAAGAGAPRDGVICSPPGGDVSPAGEASDADELAQAAVVAAVAKLMATRGGNDGELATSASPQPAARKSPLSRALPSGAVSPEGGAFGGAPHRAAMASSPAQTAAAVAARRRATMAACDADRNELLSFSSRAAPSPERPSPAPPTSDNAQRAAGPDGEGAWRSGKAEAVSEPEPSRPPEAAKSPSRGPGGGIEPVKPGRHDNEVDEPPPASAEEATTGWSWTLDSLAAALTGSFTSSTPAEQDGDGGGDGWMSNMLGGGEEEDELAPSQMRRSLDGRTPPGQKSWTRMC